MIRNNVNSKKRNRFFVFDNILGDSDWARRMRRRIVQSSTHRFNAFIFGPQGCGKRLIARALHEHGPRSHSPFIQVDCSRLPADLFRTQFFGKAYLETTTLGCLLAADGGTVFLADVDQLSLETQREVLETLENKFVVPCGSDEKRDFDVRVIAGSRKDLEREVREGRFDVELYRRLCVLPFEVTPLASRPADILPIARHLVAKLTFENGQGIKSLSSDASELLKAYDWPHNVSEMRDVLEQAIYLAGDESVIDASHVPIDFAAHAKDWSTLADVQANHIRHTVAAAGGNLDRAASMLGITTVELNERLSQIG